MNKQKAAVSRIKNNQVLAHKIYSACIFSRIKQKDSFERHCSLKSDFVPVLLALAALIGIITMGMWCRDEMYNYKLYNNLHCNIIGKCHHLAEIPTNKMKGRKRKQSIGLTSFYVQFKKKKEEKKRKKKETKNNNNKNSL